MARKVFISVLGTGSYKECIYALGDTQYDKTRFIQKATLQMLDVKEQWTEYDHIYCDDRWLTRKKLGNKD